MTKANPLEPELLWPYPVIWFADHWIKDYQEFFIRLSAANTPQGVAEAETCLRERCARDAMTAWADLCLIPLKVMTEAANAGRPA